MMVLGQYRAFMPVCIEKSRDSVGCYHSGTEGQTNKQTNKERQSYSANGPWTAEMSNNDVYFALIFPSCPTDLFNLALADLATLLFAMPAGKSPSCILVFTRLRNVSELKHSISDDLSLPFHHLISQQQRIYRRVANAVQAILKLSVTNHQCHDLNFSNCHEWSTVSLQ